MFKGTFARAAALIAVALLSLPALAAAQAPKVYRVGLVSVGAADTGILGPAIEKDFAQRGYVVGKNLVLDRRAAQGKIDQLPALVDELVADHVDVIMTQSYPAALAAKARAGKVPIVVTLSGDPVATKLVASLSHPGGNITGVSEIATDLSAKRLALLREAVPGLHSVAVLYNADDFGMTLRYGAAAAEAKRLGLAIMPLGVHAPNDFDAAFAEMQKTPPDAIMMVTDVLTILNRTRVIDFAAARRLPAIFEYAYLVHDGGLMSYGPSLPAMFDTAVGLADRILKGANPADLPLELPTRFEFAINLQTAKALGLAFPQSILVQADDVIE
jgi:putative tryptophan/tyrosine transport system substrate-binding protein